MPDQAQPRRTQSEPTPPDSISLELALGILEAGKTSPGIMGLSRDLLERWLEVKPPAPGLRPPGERRLLTIGMAVYDDYDGFYFTIQAIRLYHPEILDDVEFVVIDNNPAGPCAAAMKNLEAWAPNLRYLPYSSRQGTAVRDLVFREASGDFVLCIDSHVLFPPGTLARLLDYCRQNPACNDLLQGPLLWDDLKLSTHLEPVWWPGDVFFGDWGLDERGLDIDAAPFEIEMQGLGAFACRRAAWPGFNPRLAGFGGEEGYIHEKFRRAGGRALCLPFFRWMHRFARPRGVPFTTTWTDRIRNYLLIFDELGTDSALAIRQLEGRVGKESADKMVQAVRAEVAGPFHFFDAIYCVNRDIGKERWSAAREQFRDLGFERKVRRFAAAEIPSNHNLGWELSQRRIIAEARRQGLQSVLILSDNFRFSPEAATDLQCSLADLAAHHWQVLYLGGTRAPEMAREVPGFPHLVAAETAPLRPRAIAYHHSAFDAILKAVPEDTVDAALWLRREVAIDRFCMTKLNLGCFFVWPSVASQEGNAQG